jgi:hypothetical protein
VLSYRARAAKQLAAGAAVILAGYLTIATSCAPEPWTTGVETQVDLSDERAQVTLGLSALIDSRIETVKLRTEPLVPITGVRLLGPLLLSDAAAPSSTTSAFSTATATVTPDVASASASSPGVGLGIVPSASASSAQTQPDGSVTITCSPTGECEYLEFTVQKTADVSGRIRIFADVSGRAETCGESGPSHLDVQLAEIVLEPAAATE